MSYAYWAKGRRMRWYDWLTHLKVRSQIFPIPHANLYLLFPPERMGVQPATYSAAEVQKKTELAYDLFKQQPDLLVKYGRVTFVPAHDSNQKHPVHRFVLRQYYWMQQGLTKQAAYDKTQTEFGEVFVEGRKHQGLLKEVAAYSSAVSYHSYYQHVAAKESSFRTERLLADLEKHKRAKNYSEIDEKIPDTFKKWERIRARYYPQEPYVPQPMPIQEVKDRLFSRAEFLLNTYQHKAAITDGLRTLHDESILTEVKTAPKVISEQCKALYKELMDLGVTLSADGELDTSNVQNKELVKNLQSSELVKWVIKTQGDFDKSVKPAATSTPELPREPVVVDNDPGLKERRQRLQEAWKLKDTQKRDPAEQLNLQATAVNALRTIRKKMDQKLVKLGQEPIFPPAANAYSNEGFLIDERLDLKGLTDYLKQSSEDPTLKERERFELSEAEALATPVEVVENSVPVSVDENNSSKLHDTVNFIDEQLEELNEDDATVFESPFPGDQEPEKKLEKVFGDEVLGMEGEKPAEAPLDDSYFFDELVKGDDESAPGTRKEMIKFGKKKGKLSSAVTKLGRRK